MSTIHDLATNTPFLGVTVHKKTATASMLYDPRKDSRIPLDLLNSKADLDKFMEQHGLCGYKNIPLPQAEQILRDSKQHYRG